MTDHADQDRISEIVPLSSVKDPEAPVIVEEGSPLHRLILEHRKPQPDSRDWWQEVAQGLGVKIHDLKAEVTRLTQENARLKVELLTEWVMNHDEHCGSEGCDGRKNKHELCGWVLPESLESLVGPNS